MNAGLKIDPRKIRKFVDLGLPSAVLSRLTPQYPDTLPIQSKMLALNFSGISVYARSTPNQGKTTAAILGLLAMPRQPSPYVTNLVLVPTPALADQYAEQIAKFGGKEEHTRLLFRTGSIDDDENQHTQILTGVKEKSLTTLVATPQRILDYLSVKPDLLSLTRLRQIVIDELDVFGSPQPLETLMEYILKQPQNDPILSLLTTNPTTKQFTKLPQLLATAERPLYEVSEPEGQWDGKVIEHNNEVIHDVAGCAKRIKQYWAGAGLVIPPKNMSNTQLQSRLEQLEGAVVVQPSEVAGLHIDKLENIYILDANNHSKEDIYRLKYLLSGNTRNLHLINE